MLEKRAKQIHRWSMARKRKRPALRQFFYGLRYRIGEGMLRGFVRVLPHCPAWLVLSYMRFMARVAFFFLAGYRKRMEENLVAAFGNDLSTQERKALVWAAWLSFARGVLDTTQVMHYSKERVVST